MSETSSQTATQTGIDPRGPQFAAALTVVVILLALLLPQPWALVATVIQTVLFAIGTGLGVQRTPHAWLFKKFVRPRLGAPDELEDPAPPRFAQGVGLAFLVVALAAYVLGATLVAQIALGLALVAAVLNAVFRFCLGCEIYLLIRRFA
ncbi:DUF4395 domain-containing protein [Nocardioides albus]|uniref:ABC-type nickel/cobalt efflux system permease component RcnA n=1 Tax=Nocardioides albus TaxID=1841 RepID=A0A7W5A9H9_9ACTN|nr:DUF4395 domain-containing protein [Nocardioides albus]MBB3091709.1 ABC-type nickel/cobalt efflux system permease component RcnA [Nocardioides albus]GGU44463.1 membrane protein [Nocardioides albus]